MREFTEMLEQHRRAQGLNKKELALRAQLSPAYISLLTRGDRESPSEDVVLALADALRLEDGQRTQFFVAAGYEAQLDMRRSSVNASTINWSEAPNVQNFYGRERELEELKQWIVTDRCQLVAALGLGGIGKTMLVAKLTEDIQDQFECVFWRSLQNTPTVESIIKQFDTLFPDQKLNESSGTFDVQLSILIERLREHRCLLVLDNFESIMKGGETNHYGDEYNDYGKLLEKIGLIKHNSCLILTSRERPHELSLLEGRRQLVRSMNVGGIAVAEAAQLLQAEGLQGEHTAWKKLVDFYAGNPLVLKLAAESIREIFAGQIAPFLREEVVIRDIYALLDQQFERLSELQKEIIYWLAIEREAVPLQALRKDLPNVPLRDLLEALKSLRQRSMMETNGAAFFLLHPEILAYATEKFIIQLYDELKDKNLRLFKSHPLIKAQAKDYIRKGQYSSIVEPLLQRLRYRPGHRESELLFKELLDDLRKQPSEARYGAGNILNLLIGLNVELESYDFSRLPVWQAYLQDVSLRKVNFAYADLATSVFKDAFSSIFAVALSANGGRLAAGTASGEVRIWDTVNATPIRTLRGHTESVRAVTFSPHDNLIASGSDDRTIRIWDADTGDLQLTLQGHTGVVYSLGFSIDGRFLISGSDDRTIRLWSVTSDTCLNVWRGHEKAVYSVSFYGDGKTFVSGSEDRTVRLWNIDNDMPLLTMEGHEGRVRAVAFNPSGKQVISGGEDRTVRLWDLDTGTCVRVLRGHTDRVWSVAFSPDGTTIASGGDDKQILLWNALFHEPPRSLSQRESRIYSLAYSEDGETLACGSDNQTIHLWDAKTGASLKTLVGYGHRVFSVRFSPDGRTLAGGSEDRMIRLWDLKSGDLKTLGGHSHWVWSVAFSLDSQHLASCGEDRTVRIWDLRTKEAKVFNEHLYRVYGVAYHPSGRYIASCSGDHEIKFWDVTSGRCLQTLRGHSDRVRAMAFSPDGQLLVSGGDDQTLRIWQAETGAYLGQLERCKHRIRTVAFSPDGKVIASGSDDGKVCIWDVQTRESLRELSGHHGIVYGVVFQPYGDLLASCGHDETIMLWRYRTGELVRQMTSEDGIVYAVAFSPDGHALASGSYDGAVVIWDAQTGLHKKSLLNDRPYEDMNIIGVKGLTDDQKDMLKALGARVHDK